MDKLLASHEVQYIRNQIDDKERPEQIFGDIDGYLVEISKGQVRRDFDSKDNDSFLFEPDDIQSYSFELPDDAGTGGRSEIWHFNP